MSNIWSPVDISNWAPFSSCSCFFPLFPSLHLPFHPTHLKIFWVELFKHFFLQKNLTHLLIPFHQMISSLSCTEEERDISNEYQGCWGYIIYNIYDISKDLEITSSPFPRIAGPWPSSCFRRLYLKMRWSGDDDDVDEGDDYHAPANYDESDEDLCRWWWWQRKWLDN